MKLYLINLERERERLAFQARQFAAHGLTYDRVPAHETGRKSRFRWWCAVLRPTVKGELGCAASHLECYRRLIEGGDACAAVFEDDVVFNTGIEKALQSAGRACTENPRRVVLLGLHHRTKKGDGFQSDPSADSKIVDETWDHCSEGYVIGRDAAARLLEIQRKIRVPADFWGYFRRKGCIDLARVDPPVCAQASDTFQSGIGERYVANDVSLPARFWWKIRRCVGVILDRVLDGWKRK